MTKRLILASALGLAWLLAAFEAPAAPIGYVEALTALGGSGWACLPGGGAAVIAAYAGDRLLGEWPTTVPRPDVGPRCPGNATPGFAIKFGRSARDLLAGEGRLFLLALAADGSETLLPAASAAAANPRDLPAGGLQSIDSSGHVFGTVAAPAPPRARLFAGAPAEDGGLAGPFAAATPYQSAFGFLAALPGSPGTAGPGALLPVFGAASDRAGDLVPLEAPLALLPGADGSPPAPLPAALLAAGFAQSGSHSGFETQLFTVWAPPGLGFAGVSGTVSLGGNRPAFHEGLLALGQAPADQASCAALNGAYASPPSSFARLWSAALKSDAAGTASLPAAIALPDLVPPPQQASGTCLIAVTSAGYAYLGPDPSYASLTAELRASLAPAAGAPALFPATLDGEFPLGGVFGSRLAIVALRARARLSLDGFSLAASAASVAGAPAGSPWFPSPAGIWSAEAAIDQVPAAICATLGLSFEPATAAYDLARPAGQGTPDLPSGAMRLAQAPLAGAFLAAVQVSSWHAPHATLATGDCVLASLETPAGQAVIDGELQPTLYLRPLP